jgi:arylsulfatase
MPPPNILLLTTDQQRADTVAAWQRATGGAGTAHSPNADRLAREGVVFTDAYTASPVCAPARASLLLGVHVPVHGVFDNSITRYVVNSSTPYPSLLKKAGYVTALIGKARFRPA